MSADPTQALQITLWIVAPDLFSESGEDAVRAALTDALDEFPGEIYLGPLTYAPSSPGYLR